MATLLLTGSQKLAKTLIASLQTEGHTVQHCAFMHVERIDVPPLSSTTPERLILSSHYALHAAQKYTHTLPVCWVVGEELAKAAAQSGLNVVQQFPDMTKLTQAFNEKDDDLVTLYLRGEDIAHPDARPNWQETICYRMKRQPIPQTIITAIQQQHFDGILFHSALSAQYFAEIFPIPSPNMVYWCYSARIRDALPETFHPHCELPASSTRDALLESLRKN